MGLPSEQAFVNAVIYPIPQQLRVDANLLEMLVQRSKAPLIADVSFDPVAPLLALLISCCLWLGILAASHEKVSMLLIDCIVGEMRAVLIQVRQAEGLGGKPDQAFMVDVGAKTWVKACHQNVYSEVEFQVIYEHRIRYVLAHNEGEGGWLRGHRQTIRLLLN